MQIRQRMANILKKLTRVSLVLSGFLILGSSFYPAYQVHAQASTTTLTLNKERISLANPGAFYILDVIDKRNRKANQLGEVFVYGQSRPLLTPQALNSELYEHWTLSTRSRQKDCLPLEIVLDDVSVSERKVAPNKIAGEIRVKVSFQWTRSARPIFLTSYSTASTYTRPEANYDHEPILRRMLDGSIRHFDQWLGLNEEKNPLLARGVRVVFEDLDYAENGDTLYYKPERKLTWTDFKGNSSKPGRRYAAAVFSSMSYEGSSKMAGKYLQVTIAMKVFMVKGMSWGRADARNNYTLAHEQTHFDITRIIAERFKQKLKNMDLSIEDYDSQIQYEFLESFRDMNTEQEKYDGESQHGLNTAVQAEWNSKIKSEIDRIYRES
jgi:hypothetical protein